MNPMEVAAFLVLSLRRQRAAACAAGHTEQSSQPQELHGRCIEPEPTTSEMDGGMG